MNAGAAAGSGTAGLTFLSWYRTGLSAGVAPPAGGSALDTPPPVAVTVPVKATVGDPDNPGDTTQGNTATGSVTVRLHAPGDVTGLDPAQVLRTYPTAGAANAAPDSFPLIEFARPDVPWMLSPTGPQANAPADSDPRRGLTPWLTLVAVPAPPATLSAPAQPGGLPTLTTTAGELPDPAHRWLWAHTQVTTLSTDTLTIPELIARQPQRALSRLIAPRYLEPDTSYLACVVPVFAAPGPASATLSPAWPTADPTAQVTLPVYYSWQFTTGPAGDFRTLVLELSHWQQGGVGLRPLDVGNAGPGMPSPAAGQPPWLISLEGALLSDNAVGSIGAWSDAAAQTATEQGLATQLDGTAGELTPPRYGATQASFSGPLSGGQGPAWLRTLNLDPRYRAAASLGAALVRANQEALILSAWDQAGQVNRANVALRQGQLARELGASGYTRRLGAAGLAAPPMDDGRLLQLTGAVQGQLPGPPSGAGPPGTAAAALGANAAVAAVLTVPFRRLARPAGTLAARLAVAPLPAPVTNLAKPGGIAPVPPLTAVTGLVDLTAISANPAAPETLQALTTARVTAPRFPWEPGGPVLQQAAAQQSAAQAATAADLLVQPGYLCDLWIIGSALGRALDWDGQALAGWTVPPPTGQFTPGPAVNPGTADTEWYFPPRVSGGAASLINWNAPDISPSPAVALATATVSADQETGDDGAPANFYLGSVDCTLVGDLIPAVSDSPVQYVTTESGEMQWPTVNLMSFQWPLFGGQQYPPLTVTAAASTGDLTGTGKASVAVAWSVSDGPQAGGYLKILVDVDVTATPAKTISASLAGAQAGVQGAVLANRRVFVLAGGQLRSAPVDAATGTVGAFTTNLAWQQTQPANWAWASLAAADFSGSGRADLLFLYAVAVPGGAGAAAYRAAYRIGYEPDDNGEPAYWSDELEAPIPVTEIPTSVILGPIDQQSSALREQTAQAFRAAAGATQARMTAVIPAAASPAPPPPVDVTAIAATLRAALDPAQTVPASVTAKLSLPAPLSAAGGDPLQPVAFTPRFPQAFYQTVASSAMSSLIPGISQFPDEAVTVLAVDSRTTEAILAGANHEFSRELLWHGVPAALTATFFSRFWDGRDALGNPLADITDIAAWTAASDLGTHAPDAGSGDNAVLLIRGELVRRYPHATIYAAPAVATAGGSRTIDLTRRTDPMFSGTLGGDSLFIGFPFTAASATSGPGSPGMYFVFQEHPMAPRFGVNLDVGTPVAFGQPPADWRDLSWSQTVPDQAAFQALSYLDASSASPLWKLSRPDTPGAATTQHQWGFSAAHMAHICFRPPVLIAIHADELLAPNGGGNPS